MSFEFIKTEFEGLILIKPHKYEDFRGLYEKHYEADAFKKNGLDLEFTESSDLYSDKGAIRGIHYQTVESQAKLVRVIRGKIFDVAVDMRPESKTYMKYFSILLDDKENLNVYIPGGFAHGFMALEDQTIFSYHCCGHYLPEYCGGLRWDDPKLGIPWPVKEYGIEKVLITEKDKSWDLL